MSISEKLTTIAENEQKVYEAGKQAEYDRFWDNCQDYGKLNYYKMAFAGRVWTEKTFKPKYDIISPNSSSSMFQESFINCNLKTLLEELGLRLELKGSTLDTTFYGTLFTGLPVIDSTGGNLSNTFNLSRNLKSIEKLILREDGSQTFSSTFYNCTALEDIEIEGKIGQKGFGVGSCKKLTRDSILSILKALSLEITATTNVGFSTVHQSIIETDAECKPYWEAAKAAGWTFVYS